MNSAVAVVGGEPALAGDLALALQAHGVPVCTIGAGPPVAVNGIQHLACDLSAANEVEDQLRHAADLFAQPLAVLRVGICSSQSTATDLAALTLDEWIARTDVPLREAFAFHQATQHFFADRPGRIVVVLPTVGLSGGPGFVPLATTAEADRSLVKAQARVSGQRGVTINCLAVSSAVLAGTGTGHDPDRGGLPVPTLPTPGLSQVAGVVVAILGPAFDGVTGQTIGVDGGRWMAP